MRVLILGPYAALLRAQMPGCTVLTTTEPLGLATIRQVKPDLAVSLGYRHIVSTEVLAALEGRAFNIHISFLPWNRGADPNLWSWLENTPRGVSLHWITPRLDGGDLVGQEAVDLSDDLTLRTSHALLMTAAVDLFQKYWPDIATGGVRRIPQPPGGTYHRLADKEQHLGCLTAGWDTPCSDVMRYGKAAGLW